MIEPDEVVSKIQQSLQDAQVEIEDLTGTKDHYDVTVVSTDFEGKSRIEQHRLVYDALEDEMEGPIHALSLETETPE
ncbi:MAG: BolA family protein [Bradymonadaceae bacterium]